MRFIANIYGETSKSFAGSIIASNIIVNKTIKLKGYLAIVFQHEYDHLFGTLFVDRINPTNPFEVPSNSTPVVFKDFDESEEE